MKKLKEQKFDYSGAYIQVHQDNAGELIVIEDSSDGEGVRLGTWKLKHLVYLAKQYDQEKLGELYLKRISDLETKHDELKGYIRQLQQMFDRVPRFGWKK